ncbi:Hypothetical protein D9617_2g060000 [Elsinoe fawcettii]|nr:Hypothetical protein D9617_2g060000 [Elsinoe fawcettii]
MPAILIPRHPAVGSPEYNAQDNAERILTFLGVTGGLAMLVVMLRIYVRQFMLRFTGADDITMVLAMLFGIAVFVCFCGEVQYGMGRHMTVITPDMLQGFAHWSFYQNLFVLTGNCLAKISICLLLIRLVKHRGYVWFLWALLVFLAAYTIACIFTIVFACIPVSAAWDFSARASAKCFSLEVFTVLGVVNSAINILTDVLLAVLPIPVILAMQLNKRTKFALSFVMLLGFIAVGAGAVKLKAQLVYFSDPDRMFRNRFPIWAAIELYFGILAASLPTLKPLVAKVLLATKSASGGTGDGTGSYGQRKARRQTRGPEDYSGATGKGTFYSECTTAMGTPKVEEGSKDVGSYFSFFNGRKSESRLATTRNDSVQLETLAPTPRDREVHPAPMASDRSASVSPEFSYIVRTTKVTTSSEAIGEERKVTGKRRSQSVSVVPKREEDWAYVQPLHVRKQSQGAGRSLKRAMESEEDVRGDTESVENLVSRSH